MGRAAKPRKPHRPRGALTNPVDWAIAGAHLMPDFDRERVLAPVKAAIALLKQGRADREQWNTLAQALNIGEALGAEQVGRNLLPEVRAGQAALQSVALRMAAGGNSTCRATELAAIDEAFLMYEAQLKVCTQADLGRAVRRVKLWHSSGAMSDIGRMFEKMSQPNNNQTEVQKEQA